MATTWNYIKEFLSYIQKPEWARGIIFSVLVVVFLWIKKIVMKWFFRTLRKLDITIKRIATKDLWYWKINLFSDIDTYFVKYTVKDNWPKLNLARWHSKIAKYAEIEDSAWKKYDKFDELKNAKWIAHHEIVTSEEAIYGWHYLFEKKFNLNFDISSVKKAHLYIVVDDKCEITINNFDLAENDNWEKKQITSNDALMTLDIKDFLERWENIIKFNLTNMSFVDRTDDFFTKSEEKWKHNPYWLKYHINIIYKK